MTAEEEQALRRLDEDMERASDAAGDAWARMGQDRREDAQRLALEASRAVSRAWRRLRALLPARETPPVVKADADPYDLGTLGALVEVAPDLLELRRLLGQALDVAERIDQARGRTFSESVGGSCGWDLAEDVNQLLARVELDARPERSAR